MRRAGLLFSTDCALERFNSFRRRNQLPFVDEGLGGDDALGEQASKWQDFSLENAFRLRLLLDLMDHEGAGADEALYITRNAVNKGCLSIHPLNDPAPNGDIWAFGMVFRVESETMPYVRAHGAGRIEDLPVLIAERSDFNDGEALIRITCANATQAARFVRDRARELGLPEADDYSPVWAVGESE